MTKQIDAATGRWLDNKSWIIIIISLVSAAYFIGVTVTEAKLINAKTPSYEKFNIFMAEQKILHNDLTDTMKEIKIDLKEIRGMLTYLSERKAKPPGDKIVSNFNG